MGAGRSLLTPRRQAWGVTRLTGGQQPSAAGGTCEKMYKRQQLVCERLSPVPRAVLHGPKEALVPFAAALGRARSSPRWSISTGTSGLGLALTCSVAPQDEGNPVAQSHQLVVPLELRLRHLIRQVRGKDGQ